MELYRQGDVLLKKISKKKINGKTSKSGKDNRIVLAYGEVTGHAHAIYEEGAVLTETEDQRFLEIIKPLSLDHEEHDSIALEPGLYEVIIQREYSPEKIRRVVD